MDKPVSEPTAPAEPAPTLEQTLPTMARDAARYRWLRDSVEAEVTLRIEYGDKRELSHEYLDAAIDAAMQG